jgi:hypothetical protein
LFDNPLGEHRHAELDPAGMAGRAHFLLIDLNHLAAGLEKTRVFKKNQAQWFFFGFFGVFGVFCFCFCFYIFAQKREEFLGFFSLKNTFRCIQTFITLTN